MFESAEIGHKIGKAAYREAVPVLLEALERREMEVRHMALRVLEAITGENLSFQSDGPDDLRLKQVAHLRARFERV